MAKLVILVEQHLDRQLPTVVTQATPWWETLLAHVKLQDSGLGMHLSVNVCCVVCATACACTKYSQAITSVHL